MSKPTQLVRQVFSVIGPGLVIAAVCVGPGSVTTATKIGAQYGYQLMWVIVASAVAMAGFTMMTARFGAVQSNSFLSAIADRYGRWFAVIIGLSAFLMASCYQSGNNLGASTAVAELLGGPRTPWPLILTSLSAALVIGAPKIYPWIEKIMTVLVGVMLVAFLANLVVVGPNVIQAMRGLIPSLPNGAQGTMAAMVGTTMVMHACIYQAYLVQQKGWKLDDCRKGIRDAVIGVGFLGVISLLIMMTSAAALPPGSEVTSAADMAQQLETLFGRSAQAIFCLGLFAAAFSSLSINAIIGGGLLADGLGLGKTMDTRWARTFTVAAMVIGVAVATAVIEYDFNVVQALIIAQGAALLVVPSIGIGLVFVVNDRKLMGEHVNQIGMNIMATFGLVLLAVMLLANVTQFQSSLESLSQSSNASTATETDEPDPES